MVERHIAYSGGDVTGPPGSILEPLETGLLLVEEFARLDIDDHQAIAAWVSKRGPFEFENPYANPRKLAKPFHLRESPMMRDELLEELAAKPRQHGPWPGFHTAVAAGTSVKGLREKGYQADRIADIKAHWEQINDWLPALVNPSPDAFRLRLRDIRLPVPETQRPSFKVWLLGQHLQSLVTDALELIVLDNDDGDMNFEVVASWTSVLQPMYLQIFLSWRRAGQRLPAAARCRACGQVFLILDGRRSTYCNRACRNRFNVRAFRARAKQVAGNQ